METVTRKKIKPVSRYKKWLESCKVGEYPKLSDMAGSVALSEISVPLKATVTCFLCKMSHGFSE